MSIYKKNIMKKKIKKNNFLISIGAGTNQIPLIINAKKMGYRIVGIDKNSTAPGFQLCDLKIVESIENKEDIFDKISEHLFNGKVSVVTTASYGIATCTASFIAESFKIRYIPFNRCIDFIDKKKMKEIFKNNRIKTAEVLTNFFKKKEYNENDFPIILKPITGHAKTDVKYINSSKNLKKYLELNHKNKIIAEKFIDGDEIIIIGLVKNRKFYLVDITDKIKSEKPYFVDIMHISPSKFYNLKNKIIKLGQKVTNAFGIISSPLIIEAIVNNNEISVIEAVPEFGGEFIIQKLIPARLNYNLYKEVINAIAEKKIKKPFRKKEKNAVVVRYAYSEKSGVIKNISTIKTSKRKGIIFYSHLKKIGDTVKAPETNFDRIAVVISKAKTVEQAILIAEEGIKKLDIEIEEKNE